ncbi:diguanylate cyclase [Qipengyuania sp. NPDC077563]|uniref:sensor domain-containing diguanylate cyclase n=1 Tax=Qipengyuania sp. NPDC077563 TaxID=3364497 RepID=UPI0038503845
MLLVPAKLRAVEEFPPGSICRISVETDVSYSETAQRPRDWDCGSDPYRWDTQRDIIRYDLRNFSGTAAYPRYATFERFEFDRLTIMVEAVDGKIVSRSFGFHDVPLGSSSLQAVVELPDTGGPLKTIAVIHDGEYSPDALLDLKFSQKNDGSAVVGYFQLLAVLICGLLLTPAIFDLIFSRALREPFLLYHSLFCVMAVVQTAAVSGLLPLLIDLSYDAELTITYLSLDFMIAATILFAYHFIEPRRLAAGRRRWLLVLSAFAVLNGLGGTFLIDWIPDLIDYLYFGGLMLTFGAYFALLLTARGNGSRVAPYLLWGIGPLFLVILAQTFNVYVFGASAHFDETWLQNLALLFEVLATALAVADRFLIIRRQRDRALVTARDLEAITEHDELTGLRNRRSLEIRYPDLVKEGFTALALVDLDDFKAINDDFGHPVGDRVIQSAAWALSPGDDDDLIAFRMGGEEFLLFLRGKDAAEKAAARRKAMTARILAEVDEVDRPVTASMGFVDFGDLASAEATESFGKLYVLADRLLYDAKCSGRDAAEMEKLRAEDPIPRFSHQAAE